MSTCFLKVCYALLFLSLHTAGSIHGYNLATTSGDVKCIENERKSLLNFKQSLRDRYDMLSTWSDKHSNRDCCKWKGVGCNNETGHVHMLQLRGSNTQYLSGDISITSLIGLQNIEYFDLSFNNFEGTQIPKQVGSFSNLRYLNLSNMGLVGRIPYQLGNLSQLEYLDLKGNFIIGAIISEIWKLTYLRYVDLSHNYINGEIPCQSGNLSHLQHLDLGGNFLVGAIPSQLGRITHLRYLDLKLNHLSVEIPFHVGNLSMLQTLRLGYNKDLKINDAEWLSSLSSLTVLDLSSLTDSSHHQLQMIIKLLPKLKELRLRNCFLSDNDILSLLDSHSNFSTSLTILDLSYNMLTSFLFQLLSNLTINLQELYLSDNHIMSFPPSLNFPSLVILDLSHNNLASSVFQGHSIFSSKLEELHLENCSLSDRSFHAPSPSIMNVSSSLVILDLSNNLLTSSVIFHWVLNFTTNLHTLVLQYNLLEGPIPNGLGKEMNSLETLYLSYNNLQGEIPASLGNICTLRELYLSGNNLSGEMSSFIQNSSWCNRHIFQTLDLSYNKITGFLPDLSTLSSLRALDLSNNQLIGEISLSIGLLYKLEYLFLDRNSFEGEITELHLTNLSNLDILDLSHNSLSLKFGNIRDPPFQLSILGLATCKLGPTFPSWLQTQRYLRLIDISNAGINDSVPMWFWNKLQSLIGMDISYNNLNGTIPNIPLNLTSVDYNITYVLNSNQFEGRIPDFFSQVSTLDLSKNKFSDLNTFLCGKLTTINIRSLYLSDNQMKGQLYDCWGNLNYLESLDLSNNKLSGKIPPSMTTLVSLRLLVLRNNSFFGELPSTLKNCTNLVILEVGDNMLSGSIPSWIGDSLQQLKILSLRENHFLGTLPSHLCYLSQIHVLDFSGNNLSGNIPKCLKNFTAMVDKSIGHTIPSIGLRVFPRRTRLSRGVVSPYETNLLLTWKGQEYVFKNLELLQLLKSIDLSSNYLSGEVPVELGQLLGLVSLNLSRNNLSGEIPSDIGNLNSLEFLDLSRNHLSGRIPSTLTQIDRLAVLDLSHNSLSGKIPLGTQLQTFDPTSFEGNLNLCGKPLEKICPEDEAPMNPQGPVANDDKDENSVFYEGLYMSMGLGFFTGFSGLIGTLLLWKPWRNAYLKFLNKLIVGKLL